MVKRIKPKFKVLDRVLPDLSEMKPRQRLMAVINYTVVEKMKNFVVIQINHVQPITNKRVV